MISIQTPKQQARHDVKEADRPVKPADHAPKEGFDLLLSVLESRMGALDNSALDQQPSGDLLSDDFENGQQIGNNGSQFALNPANFAGSPMGSAANLLEASVSDASQMTTSLKGAGSEQSTLAMLSAAGKIDLESARQLAAVMSDQAARNQLAAQLAAASRGDPTATAALQAQGWLGPKAGLGIDLALLATASSEAPSTAELDLQASLQKALSGIGAVPGSAAVLSGAEPSAGQFRSDTQAALSGSVLKTAAVGEFNGVQLLDQQSASAGRSVTESQSATSAATVPDDAAAQQPNANGVSTLGSNGLVTAMPGVAPVLVNAAPASVSAAAQSQNAQAMSATVSWLASKQGGSATLDLTPPDLGQVRLELSVDPRGEQASLVVHAATEAAKASIERALSQLHAAFEASGLALTVSVDTGAASGFSQSFASQQSFQQSGDNASQAAVTSAAIRSSVSTRALESGRLADAGLSLYV
jgi:flagellar hook-length control protein FliK